MDTDVEVCELWISDEILLQSISSPSSDDEEMILEPSPSISVAQAKDAVYVLRYFMEYSENVKNEDVAIFQTEKLVDEQIQKKNCQTMILKTFKGNHRYYLLIYCL